MLFDVVDLFELEEVRKYCKEESDSSFFACCVALGMSILPISLTLYQYTKTETVKTLYTAIVYIVVVVFIVVGAFYRSMKYERYAKSKSMEELADKNIYMQLHRICCTDRTTARVESNKDLVFYHGMIEVFRVREHDYMLCTSVLGKLPRVEVHGIYITVYSEGITEGSLYKEYAL